MSTHLFFDFLEEVGVGEVEGVFEGRHGVHGVQGVLDEELVQVGSTVRRSVSTPMPVKHSVKRVWVVKLK